MSEFHHWSPGLLSLPPCPRREMGPGFLGGGADLSIYPALGSPSPRRDPSVHAPRSVMSLVLFCRGSQGLGRKPELEQWPG